MKLNRQVQAATLRPGYDIAISVLLLVVLVLGVGNTATYVIRKLKIERLPVVSCDFDRLEQYANTLGSPSDFDADLVVDNQICSGFPR